MLGPVFFREVTVTPRRPRFYFFRAVYVAALIILLCTAWLLITGTQALQNVGDLSRFSAVLFQVLAPLQLALCAFLSAMQAASSVAQEKDKKTILLLLLTRMSNAELVLGKLSASMVIGLSLLAAGFPVLFSLTLMGGVSQAQVIAVYWVTLATMAVTGSIGGALAFWREKTFQTLALAAIGIVIWVALGEAVYAGALGEAWFGVPTERIAIWFDPLRAILAAAAPSFVGESVFPIDTGAFVYGLVALVAAALLNGIAVARVRAWNPTREVRIRQVQENSADSIFDAGGEGSKFITAEGTARVAAAQAKPARRREVWKNPVLWREVCTWAYGKKILAIRATYLLLAVATLVAVHYLTQNVTAVADDSFAATLAPSVKALVPFFLLSLVIVNSLAVTSITNERDVKALDLLLATDLKPREFMLGKLLGVLWTTKEMVLLPLVCCVYLYVRGGLTTEDLFFLMGGLLTLDAFVAVLGIHCGMAYANSRSAIGVSLGTVFFLFLGVLTCMFLMISLSGSFQTQLAPFLALILGGGIGLFLALGHRNPSAAIGLASMLLPFATFYAITSFLLRQNLAVFLVSTIVYGFTACAMLIPALNEFDIAAGGRSPAQGEE
ncbi:MAG TPA: hypothetical protein VGN57_06960 [Pirellulaceae bacterium]|jgi:ABC-type Na+ efflux pump permease subunit|nr:hypothetical protein [Pirellulaceae bacterium]